MGRNTGRVPAGVTGLLDITDNPQYRVFVDAWKRGTKVGLIDRSGRGGPRWAATRRLNIGSQISFRCKVQGTGYPVPAFVENSTGTIVLQYDSGKSVTFVGDITDHDDVFDAKNQDDWIISITLNLTARPTYTGWPGTQYQNANQTFADQPTDQGTTKNIDPYNLQTAATVRVDVGNIADTDAAETAKVQQLMTSAVAVTNLKMRTGHIERSDRAGAIAVITQALTTTADDVINPETTTTIDVKDLDSTARRGLIYSPTESIVTPSTPALMTPVRYEDIKLNDIETNRVYDFGKRNTVDERVWPASQMVIDPNSLNTATRVASVDSAPTITTVLNLRSTSNQTITQVGSDLHYIQISQGGVRTTVQDRTFPGTFLNLDPRDLTTNGLYTDVRAGTNAAYTAPTGLKVVSTKQVQLTFDPTSTRSQFQTVFQLAKADSADRLVLPNTWVLEDPNALSAYASVAAVDSAPSMTAGYQITSTRTSTIVPGHTLTISRGAITNTIQQMSFPHLEGYRSAISPYRDSEVSIIDAVGTFANQTNVQWAAAQNEDYLNSVELHALPTTYGKRMVIKRYINAGILVEYSADGDRPVMTKLNGTNPQVYVTSNVQGPNVRVLNFGRVLMSDKPLLKFVIRRMIKTATAPVQNPNTINGITMPFLGQVNSGSFLGLAAGLVQYKAPAGNTNIALSGSFNVFSGFSFISDPLGIVTGIPQDLYSRSWLINSTYSGTGWVDSYILGLSNGTNGIFTPTQASFAAFNS